MRVKWYAGANYFFEIESLPVAEGIVFSITAIDRVSGKKSQINDLNSILSVFEVDEDDPRMEDKDWLFSPEKILDLELAAGEIFRDKRLLRKIESELDDDRREGEWANTHPYWKKWIERYSVGEAR